MCAPPVMRLVPELARGNNMRIVASCRGRRTGESHPAAKLTQRDVDLMRELHEAGAGYTRLAEKFAISRVQVRRIVGYQRWVGALVLR